MLITRIVKVYIAETQDAGPVIKVTQ